MDWDACLAKDAAGKTIPGDIATLNCIGPLFQNVVNWLLIFAGVVALFFVIFSGFKYITSGGDPKQLEGARHTLTYAIIGLLVILLSFFIINLIAEVTNVPCIKLFGFTNCGDIQVTPGGSGGPKLQ